MDLKLTKKQINEMVKSENLKVLLVGYADLQNLLRFKDRIGYSTRVEGWACDWYRVNNTIIATGYDTLIKGINVKYSIANKYDKQAREIICNYDLSVEEQKEQVNKLLNDFIEKYNQ